MMGAIGSLCATVFGIIWTAIAYRISPAFSLFGVVFVILGITQFIYNLHNARSENRFSEFDITENGEEKDPLQERYGRKDEAEQRKSSPSYCPYCGEGLEDDYLYCPKCGRKLK